LGLWFIAEGLPDSGLVDAVEAVLQVLMLAVLASLLSIARFNRPRILVSPRCASYQEQSTNGAPETRVAAGKRRLSLLAARSSW
jgi:hypothetical protein